VAENIVWPLGLALVCVQLDSLMQLKLQPGYQGLCVVVSQSCLTSAVIGGLNSARQPVMHWLQFGTTCRSKAVLHGYQL